MRFVYFILMLVFFNVAIAQDPTAPLKSAFWNNVSVQLSRLTASQALDFFLNSTTSPGAPAFNTSTYYRVQVDIPGYQGYADLTPQGFYNLMVESVREEEGSSLYLNCWFIRDECPITSATDPASGGRRLSTPFGGSQTTVFSLDQGGPSNPVWSVSTTSTGTIYGGRSPLLSPSTGSCTASGTTGRTSFYAEPEQATLEFEARWGNYMEAVSLLAPRCLTFYRFIQLDSAAGVDYYKKGVSMVKARNASPTGYFVLAYPVEFVDDPQPTEPTDPDTDGDGIPDSEDPTPNGDNPPPDPTDPTLEQDYEANCRIINLFCWARWAFTPQVDWTAEWAELRESLGQRAPFGYVGWLDQVASSSGGGEGLGAFQFGGATIDVMGQPVIQWWTSTGRTWLMALFYVGFFGWVLRAVLL